MCQSYCSQIEEFKNAIERAVKNHEYSNSLTFTYPQVSEMIPLTTPEIVEYYGNQGHEMPKLEVHKVFTIGIEIGLSQGKIEVETPPAYLQEPLCKLPRCTCKNCLTES